jgi:F-type H+-transporting ATPase subunit b
METTLRDLAGLLLKAVPTIFLLLIVHLYLKRMFFRPLDRVLAQRREATEGLRASAAALLAKADEQAKSIEAQLRQAREEIYKEQEEARRRALAEDAARQEEARVKARALVHQSKLEIEAEAAAAKQGLAAVTDSLADQIAQSLLPRKAA